MSLNLSTLKPAAQPKPAPVKAEVKNVNLLTENAGKRGRPAGTVRAADKAMIGFRVTKTQQREIKQLALDLDTSVNDLLLRAVDHYKQNLRIR